MQRGSSISREWWIIVHLQSTLAIMNPCMYLLLQVVKNIPQRVIVRPDPNHGPNPTRLVSVLCVLRVFHLKVKLHIKGPHNTVHVYPSYCHVNDTVQKRLVKAASPTTYRARGTSGMHYLSHIGTVWMDQGQCSGVPTVFL